jgi:hypothetical protein
VAAGLGENAAEQGDSGGLAVRAGDRNHGAAQETPGELELADDFNSLPAGLLESRQAQGHAGAGDDEVGAEETIVAMLATLNLHAERAQGGGFCGQRRFRALLADAHASAAGGEKARDGLAGAGQPNNKRVSAL